MRSNRPQKLKYRTTFKKVYWYKHYGMTIDGWMKLFGLKQDATRKALKDPEKIRQYIWGSRCTEGNHEWNTMSDRERVENFHLLEIGSYERDMLRGEL